MPTVSLGLAILVALSRVFLAAASIVPAPRALVPNATATCLQIASSVSSASEVFWPTSLGLGYTNDIYHWASSSTQLATCSVEPGTAADVGVILQILGSTGTPFAVKGGGHASNPGFSSTTGVQIAMYRFSEVTYNAETSTADIGTGLIWDDVYAVLNPLGVNVAGGRVTGVGVAGFTLGGGYSWLSNQYGLTVDTVTAFELVETDGTVTTVTDSSDPDLMFALRGGGNNFGIVTKITLKTVPQGQVWGGLITFTENEIPSVNTATANFASGVTDPKAAIITTYNFLLGQPGVSQLLFYDGPTPPSGIFDEFLAIPYLTMDVSTRDFISLVQSSPSNATAGERGIFNTVPILEYTPALIDVIVNETVYWGTQLSLSTGDFISYDIEPFQPSFLSFGSTSTAAYPPDRSQPYLPLNIYYAYASALSDQTFWDAATESASYIKSQAIAEGQNVANAPSYGNYAIFSTPVSDIYGGNLARMSAVKARVDPNNVMGQAGGFKVPE
ncbi:hypothetical protein JAAARDRAFT_194628 [Jaapia argillacea MUCL 33604]|uniref:FAD-binding PCMH-type domain-containing protein n=1 Tax=Jaapia argillacea MUCL 33604 TaxID=933084 RepID=A0A067Q214_9AGAM|nr:hypothetical protein JAAARDRAFT_194628 [Jaapia argillacea MUCL 33604]